MWIHGWQWWNMSDFEGAPLFCAVCDRDFGESDTFYNARSPNDEQVAAVRHIFGVDIFCDFNVCLHCVADTSFDDWIEERLEARRNKIIEFASHDWMREGF